MDVVMGSMVTGKGGSAAVGVKVGMAIVPWKLTGYSRDGAPLGWYWAGRLWSWRLWRLVDYGDFGGDGDVAG